MVAKIQLPTQLLFELHLGFQHSLESFEWQVAERHFGIETLLCLESILHQL